MKDSKINNDQQPLSEEEIKNAENFESVLSQYNAKKANFFKKNWHYLSAGVILIIAALFTYNNREEKSVEKSQVFELAPPIEGVDVPYVVHTVNTNKAGEISYSTGSVIRFPENAFVDINGNPVSGKVDIHFREFHDLAEIFASGIPMTYDSANIQYHFESAGMFEIKGFQNGNPIYINKEKPVVVELASKQAGDYFNLYYLDSTGTWEFLEKDTAEGNQNSVASSPVTEKELDDLNKSVKKLEKDVLATNKKLNKLIEKNIGYQPIPANDDLYAINLEFDDKEFPELVPFKGVIFEITEDNEDFTPELAKKDWDEIKLKKQLDGDYQIIMYSNLKKYTFLVRPVISNKNMAAANVVFDNLFIVYDEKLGGKLTTLQQERDSLKKVYKATSDSVENLNRVFIAGNFMNDSISESTNNITRIFTLENFGVFNSDCPQKLPKGALFEPLFVNGANKEDTLTFEHLYLAELSKNTLFSLYGYWGKPKNDAETGNKYITQEISYNPFHKTVLWGITSDNRFALIQPKDMAQLKNGGNIDAEMKVIKEKITDINKIRKLLGVAS